MMAPMAMPPAGMAGGRGMAMPPGAAAGMAMGAMQMAMPMAGMPAHMAAGGRYNGSQQQGGMQRSPRASGGHGGREGEHVASVALRCWPCRPARCTLPAGGGLCRPPAAPCLAPTVARTQHRHPATLCRPSSSVPPHPPPPASADPAAAARRRATAMCQLAGVGDAGSQELQPGAMQAAMADLHSKAAAQESPYADAVTDYVPASGMGSGHGAAGGGS